MAGGLLGGSRIGGLLGGFSENVQAMARDNPEALYALSAGLLQGNPSAGIAGMGEAVGGYRQDQRSSALQREGWDRDDRRFAQSHSLYRQRLGMEQAAVAQARQQRAAAGSATAAFLQAQGADPTLVQLAEQGEGKTAFDLWRGISGGGTDYGMTPVYGTDADGNVTIGQIGDNGRLVQTRMPEGFQPLSPYERKYGEAAGGASGRIDAERAAAAPADAQGGQNALDLINEMRVDPNRQRGTGGSSIFNSIPATGGYDFQRKVDQAKAGAFLTAIEQLQGMGALSNAEGSTATAAITRMDTATSEEAFLEALDAYEKIVQQGIDRAQGRMGEQPSGGVGRQARQPAPVDPADWEFLTPEEQALFR